MWTVLSWCRISLVSLCPMEDCAVQVVWTAPSWYIISLVSLCPVEDCAVQVVWSALSWFRLSVSCVGLCGAGGVDCTVLVWNIVGVTVSCGGLCSAGEESFFTFHWMIPGAWPVFITSHATRFSPRERLWIRGEGWSPHPHPHPAASFLSCPPLLSSGPPWCCAPAMHAPPPPQPHLHLPPLATHTSQSALWLQAFHLQSRHPTHRVLDGGEESFSTFHWMVCGAWPC